MSSEKWSAPLAARLDVDTLEDLVEGSGGFVTDRCVYRKHFYPLLFCPTVFWHCVMLLVPKAQPNCAYFRVFERVFPLALLRPLSTNT